MLRYNPTPIVVAVLWALVTALFWAPDAAHGVTLTDVNTHQPTGGVWQAWANRSRVPTVAGSLEFTTDLTAIGCIGTTLGCRLRTTGITPAIAIAPGVLARSNFYFELGGMFDWLYLNNSDRRYLAKQWGLPRWHWRDTLAGIARGQEDGLEAYFAFVYEDCAFGLNDKGAAIVLMESDSPPEILPKINTCVYIDRVARRVHADMASSALAHWNLGRLARHHGA